MVPPVKNSNPLTISRIITASMPSPFTRPGFVIKPFALLEKPRSGQHGYKIQHRVCQGNVNKHIDSLVQQADHHQQNSGFTPNGIDADQPIEYRRAGHRPVKGEQHDQSQVKTGIKEEEIHYSMNTCAILDSISPGSGFPDSASMQCTENFPMAVTLTVMVPGVSVIELAKVVRATSLDSWLSNSIIWGSINSRMRG